MMRCRPPLAFDDEFGDCGAELVFGSPIPGSAIQLLFHSAKFAVSLIGARRGRRADGDRINGDYSMFRAT
jgi:hypothetical protein